MSAKIAFWSGIFGVFVLIAYTSIGGATYPGYNHLTQYMSELGAVGAPHHTLISWGGFFLFGMLITLFAISAGIALPKSALSMIGFLGLAAYASGSTAAAFFPCDFGCRPEQPSFSQLMHTLIGGISYLLGVVGLMLLGIAALKWNNAKHLAILGIAAGIFAFIALGFLDPSFTYLGLAQRALEACINLWILACAFYIRTQAKILV